MRVYCKIEHMSRKGWRGTSTLLKNANFVCSLYFLLSFLCPYQSEITHNFLFYESHYEDQRNILLRALLFFLHILVPTVHTLSLECLSFRLSWGNVLD